MTRVTKWTQLLPTLPVVPGLVQVPHDGGPDVGVAGGAVAAELVVQHEERLGQRAAELQLVPLGRQGHAQVVLHGLGLLEDAGELRLEVGEALPLVPELSIRISLKLDLRSFAVQCILDRALISSRVTRLSHFIKFRFESVRVGAAGALFFHAT